MLSCPGTTLFSAKAQVGDIDGNKTVNNADFFQFKKAFGSKSGQPAFNSLFDFDANGTVNNTDFFAFKKNFGRSFVY